MVDPFCGKYGCTELLLAEYRRRSASKLTVKFVSTVNEQPSPIDRCACVLKLDSGMLEFQKFNAVMQTWTEFGTIEVFSSTFYQCVIHDKKIIIFERKFNEITAVSAK